MTRLFIRTEASAQIGMGHFMRCFAIAEEARLQGWEVVFLLNEVGPDADRRLKKIGVTCVVVTTAIGSDEGFDLKTDDWLLIDSYKADADYISRLKKRSRVAVIDDLNALECFDCDLLINSAMAASESDYVVKTKARLLLGAAYALIRGEFREARNAAGAAPFVSVMFGGSDPTQMTGRCSEILHKALPDMEIRLVVGPANVHTGEITSLQQRFDLIRIFRSPERVSDVLRGSALVITAAGGSVGEVAAMGLPALVLVAYDNQKAALEACPYPVIDVREGLPDELGGRVAQLLANTPLCREIAARAHGIVDGKGPSRIVEAMSHV